MRVSDGERDEQNVEPWSDDAPELIERNSYWMRDETGVTQKKDDEE